MLLLLISRLTGSVVLVWCFAVVETSDDPLPTRKHLSSKPDVPRVKMGSSRDHEIEHRERHGRMPDSATEVVRELLHYYNRHEAPMSDKPTVVRLGVYINSFYSINEQTMDYSVSMYLRQSWKDPRLEFSRINSRIEKIRMAENSWNEIWIPDTFFRNEKGASFHEVTVKNRLLRLSKTGDVWYVAKISAVLSCPMHLQRYPLDTQSCPMMFESFGYTMDTMYFAWLDTPVDIEDGLQLPQFTLVKTNLRDCSQNYTAGAFPCLEIRYILQRDIGYFLIQVYVPSILIVILSWVSFWINVDASPARVSIGLLTVLTTTTMSGGARATLPRVSYIKAIDVWMISCLVFVFSSLIEYAVVNVLARRQAGPPAAAEAAPPRRLPFRRSRKGADKGGGGRQGAELMGGTRMTEGSAPENGRSRTWVPTVLLQCMKMANGLKTESEDSSKPPEVVDGKFQARRVDKFSRRCFPLSFILFNLVYWTAYTIPYGTVPDVVV